MSIKWEFTDNSGNAENWLNNKVRSALSEVGSYVEGEAKLRAPVGQYDGGRVGGRLRGSIESNVGQDRVTVGTNVEYALFVEKGTRKMKAQPYLTPAVEDNIGNIEMIFKKNLGDR